MSHAFPKQRYWSKEAAATLLDMAGDIEGFAELGQKQLEAAVALQHMLLEHGVAYLADEVGMGKTYVALAVVAMMRHVQPDFKVLYLVPSKNVQSKWRDRELPAFIRDNIRIDGPAKRSGSADPASAVACSNVEEWVHTARTQRHVRDTFLRFSALSFELSEDQDKQRQRVAKLAEIAGIDINLGNTTKKGRFKARAAEIVNAVLPRYDLIVVDEAHLLKDGTGLNASDRAQFMARSLGALGTGGRRRFRGALLLSGTPFDRDLKQFSRQLQVFALSNNRNAPYRQIEDLADQRRQGMKWHDIHKGLAPFLVRRVQKMLIGGTLLSRNQYRREHRETAAISLLKSASDPKAAKQRLFTALVQKRLIDYLGNECAGRFPQAMFASWEAYTPPQHASPNAETKAATDEAMDTDHKGVAAKETKAIDSAWIQTLVGCHKDRFDGDLPPHPKLENEALRLGMDTFSKGHKQLVFVRRLASLGDLYWRINREYNHHLATYLEQEGVLTAKNWHEATKNFLKGEREPHATPPPPQKSPGEEQHALDQEELEATKDTLFSWFFRGKLDAAGVRFADRHKLPPPSILRTRLRTPEDWECMIGELDWRRYLLRRVGLEVDIGFDALAREASAIKGPDDRVDRYRRLQYAFLKLASEQCQGEQANALACIATYYRDHVIGKTGAHSAEMKVGTAKELLECPTIALSLALDEKGREAISDWDETWNAVMDIDNPKRLRQLQSLDLHVEVLFSLLRLDHPFIDLYIGWLPLAGEHGTQKVAAALVQRITSLFQTKMYGFGTARILLNLASGWPQVLKTNFANLINSDKPAQRLAWRQQIQQLVGAEGPVEWASGDKSASRNAVARRFRMPGYPMVLIATSVLQEGEDLHVFCDRVTHFGITGSPIGIEQKNGRVDRIGSLAQRNLMENPSVEHAGIQIWFPHLAESLEWYQIRELCARLNEYLHSMHTVMPAVRAGSDQLLNDVIASGSPIPPQLDETLHSPFEPLIQEKEGAICSNELAAWSEETKLQPNAVSGAGSAIACLNNAPSLVSHLDGTPRISSILHAHSLQLRQTKSGKSIAVINNEPAFKKRFKTDRMAKLINNELYITLPALHKVAHHFINQVQQPLLTITSSNSNRLGMEYPGFDTTNCSEEQLICLVKELMSVANQAN